MASTSKSDEHWTLKVTDEMADTRIDALIAKAFDGLSRTRIKNLILAGAVHVDGVLISEPKRRVKSGQHISLVAPPLEEPTPEAENIPLSILFEDDDLIVINKPVGMVVHPAPGSPSGTLVNALIYHCGDSLKGIGGVKRPGIVHRLDKNTTGVMVAAKTDLALAGLAAQFADHGRTGPLKRSYRALAWERLDTAKGTIDAPLGRDARNRLKQAIRPDGRHAITHFQVLGRFGDDGWAITELQCRLETGRTHQIRVHMASIGAPLIADSLYSSGYATKANRLPSDVRAPVDALWRQALHAEILGFAHPTSGEEMLFEAPIPADMARLLDALAPYRLGKAGRTDKITVT